VLPDDVGVNRAWLDVELFREQALQASRVDQRACPHDLSRRKSRDLLGDLRQDVHGVGRPDQDTGKSLGLSLPTMSRTTPTFLKNRSRRHTSGSLVAWPAVLKQQGRPVLPLSPWRLLACS